MGEVYLARATGPSGFEKRVAIKLLPERYVSDDERSRRLMWEAMVASQLDHPNIVSVLDVGDDDGRPYLVMEYVRGHSLGTVLDYLLPRPESLPLASVVLIGRAVARALEYIHTLPSADGGPRGLIHGDVSPSNVLLGIDGQVKLADFGVASAMSDRSSDESVGGKLPYMPAEAFSGCPPQPSWDVYALGCTLYEMLAGEQPFPGRDFPAVQRALRRGAPPIAGRLARCPEQLAAVIDQSIDRERRFGSAAEMLTALQLSAPGEDPERHLRYVTELFCRDGFISRYGELPPAGSISTRPSQEPLRELALTPTTPQATAAPIRFGLSPALGAELARSHGGELAVYLSERLRRQVLTTVFADYHALSEALLSGAIDAGWMPPLELLAVVRGGGGALVQLWRGGRADYKSAIFVRADSPYTELTDLEGKSFAWVDRRSSSGYIAAHALLCLAFGTEEPPIGKQHFHGSHRAVCDAVLNGWADAGATYARVDESGAITSAGWNDVLEERAAEIRSLAVSPDIPSDAIAHRPRLPKSDRAALADVLEGMADDERGRDLLSRIFNADGFQRVTAPTAVAAGA